MINFLESFRRDDIIPVSSTISFSPVTTAPKKNISPFDDKTAVIPIYFVNLDSSKDRRKEFENEFSLLPKESNLSLHRVSGVSIEDVKQMMNEKQLLLNDKIKLSTPENRKVPYVFKFGEAGCTLSHLKAIKQAYDDGQDMAIIIEDDALLTNEFAQNWRQYAATAPSDWSILQLLTSSDKVNKRNLHRHNDYWINWYPYHWSTVAYVINRKGMKEVLDKTYIRDQSSTGVWQLKEPYILSADKLLYHLVSRAYTSTYPWIAVRDVESTIPGNLGRKRDLTFGRSKSRPLLDDVKSRDESIAVVTSLHCTHEDDIMMGLETLKMDMSTLARSNPKSSWFVNVVLVEEKLRPIFEKHVESMKLPSNHFFVTVNERRFNKFLFVPRIKASLGAFDYVLFKDNDINLSGFAWNTFMDLKKDSVIAGPFINKMSKAFKIDWRMINKDENVNFQDSSLFNLYSYDSYKHTSVYRSKFLQMQFVLMKTDFSLWFFDQIGPYMDEESNGGIDLMWCEAADAFNRVSEKNMTNFPCALVSLDALGSDRKQIDKSGSLVNNDFAAVEKYQSNQTFSKWIEASACMRPETIGYKAIKGCQQNIGEYASTCKCQTWWRDYWWQDLSTDVKDAAKSIGFDESIWDNNSWPVIGKKLWTDMSKNEIDALLVLGYSERKWERHLKSSVG